MSENVIYRILVRKDPEGARELIERELGIKTWIGAHDAVYTAIDFEGPRGLDLDFLRPQYLPPR